MIAMQRRHFVQSITALALVFLLAGPLASSQDKEKRGRKYKAAPPTAKIEVTVLRDSDQKPLENAAVIFHTLNDPGNMELKSNEEGKAIIDVLPIGETVRLQIIAKGYKTFGGDYKIDKDQMAIEIHMVRPKGQYSIYKDNSADGQSHDPNRESGDKSKPETPKN